MKHTLFIIIALLLSFKVSAQQMAMEYQVSEHSTDGIRVALTPYKPEITQLWGLKWHMEASVSQWVSSEADAHRKVNVVALSPVLSKSLGYWGNGELSFGFGIGLSLLDKRTIGSKNLGTNFQFEDRLGLRWRSHKGTSITLRYMHYSNGGLGSLNPGMDFINLSVARPF